MHIRKKTEIYLPFITARNPQTGEEMHIPASKVPAFKPGKELKEAVK
jgi:nucleoid DNA-binding protein